MKNRFFTDLVPEPDPATKENICVYAQRFETWARRLCEEHQGSIVAINQAKCLLIDAYFSWRSYVPRSHRNRVSERGHRCIFSVLEESYSVLRILELSLTPPMLFLPPDPVSQPRPQPQIAGIFIGEVEEK